MIKRTNKQILQQKIQTKAEIPKQRYKQLSISCSNNCSRPQFTLVLRARSPNSQRALISMNDIGISMQMTRTAGSLSSTSKINSPRDLSIVS